MCYSAMVKQSINKLGVSFHARIQFEEYRDIFVRRFEGERLMINKAMEYDFTHSEAKTPIEKEIKKSILGWHEAEISRLEREIFAQTKRLNGAERSLAQKITKKAENDRQVAIKKIAKAKEDLEKHRSIEIISEVEERVFPFHYISVLCLDEKGEKIVRPMRYLMRPHNKDESFDRQFSGCYCARLDSLKSVPWWKDSLDRRHGIILIKKFYENVEVKKYERNFNLPQGLKDKKSIVLCFEPEGSEYLAVPVLWDKWTQKGSPDLYSMAVITDNPPKEIAQTGHNRTPIFLEPSAIEHWLRVGAQGAEEVLNRRQIVYCAHHLVDAA